MMRDSIIQLFLLQNLLLWSSALAFVSHRTATKSILILRQHVENGHPLARLSPPPTRQLSSLFQSSSELDGESPKQRRRKRVKRKEVVEEEEAEEEQEDNDNNDDIPAISTSTSTSIPESKARGDNPVRLQVRDVRTLVSGGGSSPLDNSGPVLDSRGSNSAAAASSSSSRESLSPDSLRMLLEDAKELQALESKSRGGAVSTGDGEFSLPDTLKSILSTLVTVDFFVVCAFLVWFLAGIFCSYVLKDDTVQIAFNRKWW